MVFFQYIFSFIEFNVSFMFSYNLLMHYYCIYTTLQKNNQLWYKPHVKFTLMETLKEYSHVCILYGHMEPNIKEFEVCMWLHVDLTLS